MAEVHAVVESIARRFPCSRWSTSSFPRAVWATSSTAAAPETVNRTPSTVSWGHRRPNEGWAKKRTARKVKASESALGLHPVHTPSAIPAEEIWARVAPTKTIRRVTT